ncbi:MAG TPA: hypothetical protein VEM13_11345 [Gemmatimonadales bacterium]|nr:hypothetical protein [Gemmatimonadales bacterium]
MRSTKRLIMRRAAGCALGFALVGPVAGAGQAPGLREVRSWGAGGIGGILGVPVGEFRNYVSLAGGVGGSFAVNLDRAGAVSLRVDAAYLTYGHENRPVFLSGTGGLVSLNMGTDFFIASLRAGPQLTLGQGRVRAYGFGTMGASYFATRTALTDGGCGCYDLASTTNYDDGALSLAGGGGLLIDLSRGRHPVSLDLGASYVRNGQVSYLREGSIVENPDGSLTLSPVQSAADLVVLQLGVSIGLR